MDICKSRKRARRLLCQSTTPNEIPSYGREGQGDSLLEKCLGQRQRRGEVARPSHLGGEKGLYTLATQGENRGSPLGRLRSLGMGNPSGHAHPMGKGSTKETFNSHSGRKMERKDKKNSKMSNSRSRATLNVDGQRKKLTHRRVESGPEGGQGAKKRSEHFNGKSERLFPAGQRGN